MRRVSTTAMLACEISERSQLVASVKGSFSVVDIRTELNKVRLSTSPLDL